MGGRATAGYHGPLCVIASDDVPSTCLVPDAPRKCVAFSPGQFGLPLQHELRRAADADTDADAWSRPRRAMCMKATAEFIDRDGR